MRPARRRPRLRVPRHRGTTAHLCALYPFSVQSGLGPRGVYVGADLLTGGGPFCWDPFEAYDQQLTTNPNTWVLGEPGNGKSALIKTLLYRMAGLWGLGPQGRFLAICDPKGEYRVLAELLDLPVIRLAPGGTVRLNPLDTGPGAHTTDVDERVRHHAAMLTALIATVMRSALSPFEDAVLFAVIDTLARGDTTATLADVADDCRALVYALDKLLNRSLRGMFDGPSTITVDWNGPGLVVDLSAVQHDPDALPLVMVAATGWLQTLMAEHRGRRRLQVLDEAWCLLSARHTANYVQSCWKLGRSYGVANLAVAHRPTDLAAQADDGTATAKIAAGLLADTATKIVLRQAPDQLAAVGELVGLRPPERSGVGHLVRGRALWRVGSRTAVVQHHLGSAEQALCDTDTYMRTETS